MLVHCFYWVSRWGLNSNFSLNSIRFGCSLERKKKRKEERKRRRESSPSQQHSPAGPTFPRGTSSPLSFSWPNPARGLFPSPRPTPLPSLFPQPAPHPRPRSAQAPQRSALRPAAAWPPPSARPEPLLHRRPRIARSPRLADPQAPRVRPVSVAVTIARARALRSAPPAPSLPRGPAPPRARAWTPWPAPEHPLLLEAPHRAGITPRSVFPALHQPAAISALRQPGTHAEIIGPPSLNSTPRLLRLT